MEENSDLNLEKETKRGILKDADRSENNAAKSSRAKKEDSSKQHKQYPSRVGYHGTDKEENLNPEE